jgi:hypothetical protein
MRRRRKSGTRTTEGTSGCWSTAARDTDRRDGLGLILYPFEADREAGRIAETDDLLRGLERCGRRKAVCVQAADSGSVGVSAWLISRTVCLAWEGREHITATRAV